MRSNQNPSTMSIFYVAFICLLIISGTTSNDFRITGKEAEEYDVKLSEFLREILENFREQMPDGLPDVGIPPIDPLIIPDIDEDVNENVAKMALRMRQLNITGISHFQIEDLKADLERGFANFSFSVPQLIAEGHCYMNGKILNIFPITSDGPFFINVTEVRIQGYGDLNVTTGAKTRLHMNDLQLNLTFGPLDMEFKSLLGGEKWTQVLVKLIAGMSRGVFNYFREEVMQILNKSLLKLINKELDKGTLSELLDQLP